MDINKTYFKYLCDYVVQPRKNHYKKLLSFLHSKEFTWDYEMDANRAYDGIELRRYFELDTGNSRVYLSGPCSILEMMVALSIRIEKDIMEDLRYGDRTSQWFWIMIHNLGLGQMTDAKFDEDEVDEILDIFLRHDYEPNGRGGLFIIDDEEEDLRDEEIWTQMCWYVNTLE